MDEAFDEGVTLAHPPVDKADKYALAAHESLCAGREHAAICTLLLVDAGKATGTFTLERHQGPAFYNTSPIDLFLYQIQFVNGRHMYVGDDDIRAACIRYYFMFLCMKKWTYV